MVELCKLLTFSQAGNPDSSQTLIQTSKRNKRMLIKKQSLDKGGDSQCEMKKTSFLNNSSYLVR